MRPRWSSLRSVIKLPWDWAVVSIQLRLKWGGGGGITDDFLGNLQQLCSLSIPSSRPTLQGRSSFTCPRTPAQCRPVPVARVHSERGPATNAATQAARKEDSLGVTSGGEGRGGEGETPRQRAAFPRSRCWCVCISNAGAGAQHWVVARACGVVG